MAARRVLHPRLSAGLRTGLPRRRHRRPQPGSDRAHAGSRHPPQSGPRRRCLERPLLDRPLVQGRPDHRRQDPPVLHDVRLHAERALTLIAQARAAYPAAAPTPPPPEAPLRPAVSQRPPTLFPSNPHHACATPTPSTLSSSARAASTSSASNSSSPTRSRRLHPSPDRAASSDHKLHATVTRELGDIRGVNGRIADLRDGYALLRDLYEQAWLRSNRAYALRPVLEHYDTTIQLWQARSDRFRTAQRQYGESKTLPSATDLGLPSNLR